MIFDLHTYSTLRQMERTRSGRRWAYAGG